MVEKELALMAGAVLASLFVEPETDAEVCAKGNGIAIYRRVKIINKSVDGQFRIAARFERIDGL